MIFAKTRLVAQSRLLPSGCRVWTGYIKANGYGQITINDRPAYVHRVAYQVWRGKIPRRLLVCHTCDVRTCIEPSHLFLGTHKDNSADMVSKGRAGARLRGEASPNAKLTVEKVKAIRADKRTQRAIAATYGVSCSRVCDILNGRTWLDG